MFCNMRTSKVFSTPMSISRTHRLVSVLQWNVLARHYATPEAFPKADARFLDWGLRSETIVQNIMQMAANVVCLQEVDKEWYEAQLKEQLSSLGYESVYREAMFQSAPKHGLVVAWMRCELALAEVPFTQQRTVTVVDASREVNSKCATFAFLRWKDSSSTDLAFCVVCTHFKAKEEFESVRVLDANYLLKEAIPTLVPKTCPVLICGDLNTEPTGRVYPLFRGMGFSSVYGLDDVCNSSAANEPPFTTYKMREREICRTIDYIWFRGGRWFPRSRLEMPQKTVIGPDGLPADGFPSDHLPLLAQLWV
jgi:mRNA deadenylase 3'-5' endonuclease subunit Ccr4